MAITNIETLIKLISTSQAAYANFTSGANLKDVLMQKGAVGGADFTEKEADEFIKQYEIITPTANYFSGFQAVVFEDKKNPNQKIIAIRGSEQIGRDFIWADGGDIRSQGFAASQAVDLYRYWKSLTTQRDVYVPWTNEEILKLFFLSHPNFDPTTPIVNIIDSAEYLALNFKLAGDRGLGVINANEKVDVTGHSLGGNLAYVFASMFHDNVNQVVTINAPGLAGILPGSNAQEYLTRFGFSNVDPSRVTSIDAEGDLVHFTSGTQPGKIIDISQEVGHGAFDGLANNHSVINGLDSLNLMNLFSKLDPTQANNASGILSDIMRASSYKLEDSYENMLDGLRKMLLGFSDWFQPTNVGTKNDLSARNNLYKNMDELNTKLAEGGALYFLVGKVKIVESNKDFSIAKTDYGQFLALYFLTPFALNGSESDLQVLNSDLYEKWHEDQGLSEQDQNNGKANFSDVWYETRSAMQAALISRNTADDEIDTKTNSRNHVGYSDDLTGFKVMSQPQTYAHKPLESVLFGDRTANTLTGFANNDRLFGDDGNDTLSSAGGYDYLEGGAGNDLLYGGEDADQLSGGAGDDQMVGGDGDDILVGGEGNDTYAFTGAFGRDVIKDSDNQGSIVISGTTLSTLKQTVKDGIIYLDDIDHPKYEAVKINEGNTTSLIIYSLADKNNSITIKNWSDGNLGINLTDATSPAAGDHVGTVNGNGGGNVINLWNLRENDPDFWTRGYTSLTSNAGGGNDIINGTRTGNDVLNGGSGNDVISGGFTDEPLVRVSDLFPTATGIDIIHGDDGDDFIGLSPAGGSIAHGDDGDDSLSAIGYFYIDTRGAGATSNIDTEHVPHGAVSREQVWADMQQILTWKTEVDSSNENYTVGLRFKGLTTSFQIFNSVVAGTTFIARLNPAGGNGTYEIGYDYTTDGGLKVDSRTLIPFTLAMNRTIPVSPKTYNDFANEKGANLFGDKGNDMLESGMFSDYLSGGADKDTIFAGYGNDVLDGGTEDDKLYGEAGNDLLIGGDGNDLLLGGNSTPLSEQSDNDTLYGGKGIDDLQGKQGDDYLDGGIGTDLLSGGEGNDYLYGGDDDERDDLSGDGGDDILVLGKNDYADGGSGKNIYIWDTHQVTTTANRPTTANFTSSNNSSSGNSLGFTLGDTGTTASATSSNESTIVIYNSEGHNTLAIAGMNNLGNTSLGVFDNNLSITTSDNQKVIIQDAQENTPTKIIFGNSIEQLAATSVDDTPITDDHFLNGIAPLEQTQVTTTDFILGSLQEAITYTATSANNYVAGGLFNDSLTANVGGSTLIGGKGDDNLFGDVGSDTYLIRKGDDNDTITEKGAFDPITQLGGKNHIKLDKNIAVCDVKVARVGADLVLTISDQQRPSQQSVTVKNMFNAQTGALITANAIQDITFYDNTVWDINQIKQQMLSGTTGDDLISGFETNDVIVGGKGNDKLSGGDGNDIYQFSLGDGSDVVSDASGNDVIQLGAGIAQADVITRRDSNNNIILSLNSGEKITIENAVDANGNFTSNAIETIKFSDNSTWDLARIKTEILKDQVLNVVGTIDSDNLTGDAGKEIIRGGLGNDQITGDAGDDIYQYTLGDGKDVITDINGNDRIEFLSGVTSSDVVAHTNGKDLILNLTDGGKITVKDMFVTKTPNVADPVIVGLVNQLQTRWLSQAETLIENNFGLVGSGDITIQFAHGIPGSELANVGILATGPSVNTLTLTLDLDDFSSPPNGSGPLYYDRVIAHEMVHAVMARSMDVTMLPGWFTEGAAEFIHGADERVKADLPIIQDATNFGLLLKTTAGSPSSGAGYSVGYIAVKMLDAEIRNSGGAGIKDVFDQLKTGKTLDQSLVAVSNALGGLSGLWTNLATFESHVKTAGAASINSLLNIYDQDTGSIAGSDYGNNVLNAHDVLPDNISGPSKHFNIIVPQQYINSGQINNEIETIKFSDGEIWDIARIKQEALSRFDKVIIDNDGSNWLQGGMGDDTFVGNKGNDVIQDSGGNDVYRYVLGDGNDSLSDYAGNDRIEFGAGILSAEVKVKRDSVNNLVFTLSDGATLTVAGGIDSSNNATAQSIETIQFSDGSIWDTARIKQEVINSLNQTIVGTDGPNTLRGDIGNDTLIGGKGDDYLQGGAGNDTYQFNVEDNDDYDRIVETEGVDIIKLGAGFSESDVVIRQSNAGYESNLSVKFITGKTIFVDKMFDPTTGAINSNNAIEQIQFNNGTVWDLTRIKQEALKGTSGSDTLYGFDTNDVIIGGAGNDYLSGLGGDDIYQFNRGDGVDNITETGGIDIIKFGASINESDVTLRRDYNGNLNVILNTGEEIDISGMYNPSTGNLNTAKAIEQIQFTSGQIWDSSRIAQEVLKGVTLVGTNGPDNLVGGSGRDTLIGGTGNDTLNGGAENDVYRFNRGDGADTLSASSGTDRIEFGVGINPADVTITRINWSDILIGLNTGESITVKDMFTVTGDINYSLEMTHLANGFTWTTTAIKQAISLAGTTGNDTIYGFSSNDLINGGAGDDVITGLGGIDTLIGGVGNDVIYGGGGDTIFIFNKGDGHDTINDSGSSANDRIEFGAGIQEQNVSAKRVDGDIVLQLDSGESINMHVQNGQSNGIWDAILIDKVRFASGVEWSFQQVLDKVYAGTDGNDSIRAFDISALVNGGKGDDELAGGNYNDTLVGGLGNDIMSDSLGNDIYRINRGDGFDKITDYSGNNRIEFGPTINESDISLSIVGNNVLLTVDSTQKILIQNAFDSARGSINQNYLISGITFSNGNTWNQTAIINKITNLADTTAPAQPSANIDSTGKIISGNAEAGSFVSIQGAGNTPLGGSYADVFTGNYSIEFSTAFSNGETLSVTAQDIRGNVSTAKTIVAQDKTPPVLQNAAFDSTGKVVSGSAEAGSTVIVKNAGGTQLGTAIASVTNGAYTITLATALINKEAVNVTAKDAAGNTSVAIAINAPDKTPPGLPVAAIDTTGKIITGSAEAGSTVIAKNASGTQLGSATASSTNGAYTITLATALINFELLNVTAKDAAGNISAATTINAPDKTAPGLPSAAIDTTGKIITGNAEASSTVIVKNAAGTQLGTATANTTNGAYTITLSTALLNFELLNITAKDAAGNISAVKSINAPDKTAPGLPSAAIDTTGKIVSGSAEAGSTVIVKNTAGTQLGTATASVTDGKYAITLATALINKETVNVTAKDVAGNISPVTTISAPDKTAPGLPSAAIDTTGKIITGSAEASSIVIVKNAAGTQLGTATASATNGAYTITLATALINFELLNVTATDTAGNISAVRAINAPDKTAPGLPSAAIDTTGKIITGSAEAGSTVIVKNSSGTQLGTATASATNGVYTITLATALLNFELLNVTAKDAAGNISAVRAINAPDKTAPGLPSAAIDTTGKIITGSAEAGSTVIVKNAGGTQLGTATASATNGAYTITLATALLNFELLNVTAKDAAGNISAVKSINAPDKTAPGIPTAGFNSAGKIISGNAEAGSTVIVKNSGNTATLGSGVATAQGTYSITLATALTHKESVNVTAKDAAGNVSGVKTISAPQLAVKVAQIDTLHTGSISSSAQTDALIQAMAAFSPPAAAETKTLVGISDTSQPMLVSHG